MSGSKEAASIAAPRLKFRRSSSVGLVRAAAILPIRVYQLTISPILPPACRFSPNCSSYAIGAITRHGVARGILLAARRLLRCHPFSPGGFDPVPPVGVSHAGVATSSAANSVELGSSVRNEA